MISEFIKFVLSWELKRVILTYTNTYPNINIIDIRIDSFFSISIFYYTVCPEVVTHFI